MMRVVSLLLISASANINPNIIKELNSFGQEFAKIQPSSSCPEGKASSSLSAMLALAMATLNTDQEVHEQFWAKFGTDHDEGLAAVKSIMAGQEAAAYAKEELLTKLRESSDSAAAIKQFVSSQGLGWEARRNLEQMVDNDDWEDAVKKFLASSVSEFTIANSVWANGVLDDFKDKVEDIFKAEVHPKTDNFMHEANKWVCKNTNEMIPTIFKENPAADAVLINALAFKGYWTFPFDEKHTQTREEFDNKPITYKMMYQKFGSNSVQYVKNQAYQAVRLPYEGLYDAVVILPSENTTTYDMSEVLGQLRSNNQELQLYLPKFRLETTFDDLIPEMKKWGITKLFHDDAIKMTKTNMYVDQVMQKVVMEVDEAGTKAAALTCMMMCGSSCFRPPPPETMMCDRPFWFNLVERDTDLVLFWSQVKEPTRVEPQRRQIRVQTRMHRWENGKRGNGFLNFNPVQEDEMN